MIFILFCDVFCQYKSAGRSYQKLHGHQPIPASMRVFVCLLFALALCQGNHINTTLGLQSINQCKNSKSVYTFHCDTTTRLLNVHFTKQIYGHETCGRNTLTHCLVHFCIFWQLHELLLWKVLQACFFRVTLRMKSEEE